MCSFAFIYHANYEREERKVLTTGDMFYNWIHGELAYHSYLKQKHWPSDHKD